MRGERKTEILNYRPPLFAASALIAGILLGALLRNTLWGLIASIAVSVAFAAVAFLKKYKVLRLALVFAVLGMVVVTSFFAVIAPESDPGFGYIRGRVGEVGKTYYGYTRYVIEDVTINGEKARGNLYLKSASELETGDIVEFAAVTEAVNPDPFDTYSSTYYENGISFEAECDFVSIKGKDKLTLFEKFGLKLEEVLSEFAGEEAGGVLKGLLLGGDENIDGETVADIRAAGLSHVLSVSGLHVGFLCAMIYSVFRLLGRPPKKALTVLAILLPVYAAMTGFAPGVVRASVTALVFLFSLRTGRRFDALNALSLSAIIILLIWPWALFDLSFQMSFAAVLGIILFMNPIIRAFKPRGKISGRLCSAAALSVLAAFAVHEAGHCLAARLFGEKLAFRFALGRLFGKIPIPRIIWDMPESLTARQKKIVALAGFGLELLAALPCALKGFWIYPAAAALHLALYPLYAGENNDFRWV